MLSYTAASGRQRHHHRARAGRDGRRADCHQHLELLDQRGRRPRRAAGQRQHRRLQPCAISNFVGGVAQGGTVTVSTSRGTVYADAGLRDAADRPLALVAGTAPRVRQGDQPWRGHADRQLQRHQLDGAGHGRVRRAADRERRHQPAGHARPWSAPTRPAARSQQVTLRAVVSDKASQSNPVKNRQGGLLDRQRPERRHPVPAVGSDHRQRRFGHRQLHRRHHRHRGRRRA